MIDVLPSEILAAIATHLSKSDLCVCVRVCRLWNVALIPTLYGVVDIRSEYQLYRFNETLCSVEKESALGHLVRVLKISVDVDEEEYWTRNYYPGWTENDMWDPRLDHTWAKDDLPRLCPFVTEFGWTYEWYYELAEFMQKWKNLTNISLLMSADLSETLAFDSDFFRNRLTQLTIQCTDFSEWRDFVAGMPCVEYLKLLPAHSYNETEHVIGISVSDLEIIHKALRFLRSLTIGRFNMYGRIAEYITPCATVRELFLTPINGYVWGRYFVRKYPNLGKLKLAGATIDHEDCRDETMALLRSHRGLESAKPLYNSYQFGLAYNQLLQIVKESGIPERLPVRIPVPTTESGIAKGCQDYTILRLTLENIDFYFISQYNPAKT